MLTRRDSLAALGVMAVTPTVALQDLSDVRRGTYPTRDGENPVVVVDWHPGDAPMAGTTLILLHGSGGLQSALPVFIENARRLSERGYRVVMPVYMSAGYDAADTDDPAWWTQAVKDAVAWAMRLPGARPERLVAMGYSRGGYLAAEAAVRDVPFAAVVGVASAGNAEPADMVRKPPILLIHATGDPVVRASRVRRWADVLREGQVPVQVQTLPVSRHAFEDEEWRDMFDAADRFFRRVLADAGQSTQ